MKMLTLTAKAIHTKAIVSRAADSSKISLTDQDRSSGIDYDFYLRKGRVLRSKIFFGMMIKLIKNLAGLKLRYKRAGEYQTERASQAAFAEENRLEH